MTERKQTVAERLEELKRQQEAVKSQNAHPKEELIEQLTHESDGGPDFTQIIEKLQQRKEEVAKGENEGYQKMTIYIRDDIADSFNALLTKRGDQKKFANIAFADFVKKKVKELGLE